MLIKLIQLLNRIAIEIFFRDIYFLIEYCCIHLLDDDGLSLRPGGRRNYSFNLQPNDGITRESCTIVAPQSLLIVRIWLDFIQFFSCLNRYYRRLFNSNSNHHRISSIHDRTAPYQRVLPIRSHFKHDRTNCIDLTLDLTAKYSWIAPTLYSTIDKCKHFDAWKRQLAICIKKRKFADFVISIQDKCACHSNIACWLLNL
jgi:hypothetical protein